MGPMESSPFPCTSLVHCTDCYNGHEEMHSEYVSVLKVNNTVLNMSNSVPTNTTRCRPKYKGIKISDNVFLQAVPN